MESKSDDILLKLLNTPYSSEFKDVGLDELLVMCQKEESLALEEFFDRFNQTLVDIATGLSVKYRFLEDDVSLYFDCVYKATSLAISTYSKKKGNFIHLWRTILMWEKKKVISSLQNSKKPCKSNIDYESSDTREGFFDYQLENQNQIEKHFDPITSSYEKESSELVLSFVKHHYSQLDYTILSMWMYSYSLKEISEYTCQPLNVITSKVYSLLDSIRAAIKNGNLQVDCV